jgi:hypothetical protein
LTKLEGTSPDVPRKEFFGSAGALPSRKNRSPFVAFPTADLPTLRLVENSFVDAQKACYNESSALRVLTPEKGRAKIKVTLEGIDAKKKAC